MAGSGYDIRENMKFNTVVVEAERLEVDETGAQLHVREYSQFAA